MPPTAPDLMEDLVEDILIRFPPEDPGCLFRAAIICKRWRGLLTGRAFARRYSQFHRAPPLLGFFENHLFGCEFTAFSSPASPVPPIHPGHRRLNALDSRHGLVLLVVDDSQALLVDRLAVWDPLCRRQWEFPFPDLAGPFGFGDRMYSAAVLCAADGCDHLNCRAGDGHFLVAFLWSEGEGGFHASMYSSEFRAWSPVTSVEHPVAGNLYFKPKVLVGNVLYFTCQCDPTVMILRYDLASWELSIMGRPAGSQANYNQYVLVGTGADNGVLGFANVQGSMLCVWSMEASANGRTVAWGKQRVVELEKLLPPHAFSAELYLTGFTEGVGVIVVTNAGTFAIELKSGRVKDVPGRNLHSFPYSSFYTPDQVGVILPRAALEVGPYVMLQQPNMDVSEEREDDDDNKDDDDYEEESEWKDDDDDEESGEDFADDLEQANLMFDMWSKAIVDGDFGVAVMCATSTLECRFSCHGKLSPKCAYTYYIFGCTLLYRPQPDIEPSLERDGVEDLPDFHPAWKLLHIARTILERCPGSIMEKVKVFSALADVKLLSTLGRESMRLEDKDYSLGVCLKALAISEHLIEPDNYWIIKLNVSICLIFEFVSNIGDAVAYCAKAISLCQSRISNLKNASASAAGAGLERSPLDYEMEFLTGLACKLEKKLEHLKQAKPTPTTKASGERNVGVAIPRAASSTPFSNLLELLSVLDPVLHKTSCTPIWSELQDA